MRSLLRYLYYLLVLIFSVVGLVKHDTPTAIYCLLLGCLFFLCDISLTVTRHITKVKEPQ